MSYNREYLGSVLVKSGVIRLGDPSLKPANEGPAIQAAQSQECYGSTDNSLYISTFFKDGRYSVFGHYNESSELTSVEILLDEVET